MINWHSLGAVSFASDGSRRWLILFCVGPVQSTSQGIGSDASYNPTSGGYGSGSSPGGLSPEEIGGQIGQMGQKSMRFLSQSFSTLQTGVERTAHSLEEQKIGQSLRYFLSIQTC